jgi:uncharacterized protein DUF5666/uncharacterized protein DUF5648
MFAQIGRAAAAVGIAFLACFGAGPALSDGGSGNNETEFTGTVQAMPGSGLVGSWTIAGKTVQTNASTQFDQQDGHVGIGAVVKVEGIVQSDGSVLAQQIDVKAGVGVPPPPGGSGPGDDEGDFTGAIQSLPSGLLGTWQIAGRTVQVVSTTTLDQENGGFAPGAIVEVEGLPDANGVIVASRIELKSGGTFAAQPEPEDLEIIGTIGALPASGLIGTWQVAGRSVVVTAATELDAEHGSFAVGVTVEVEGALDATGAVIAAKVESKPGSGASEPPLDFFGTVNALPSGASGLIGVWNVGGKLVNVTAQTVIDADEGPIAIGAAVEVRGWQQPDGMIDAQRIESHAQVGVMAGVGPQAVEFFDSALKHFFVTASTAEIAALDSGAFGGAWQRTGQTFNVGGTTAVCRFYGMPPRGPDSHFFTADPSECAFVMGQFSGWTFEGHAFATTPAVGGQCAPGLLPVNRFFNNPTSAGEINHRFTVTQQAFDQTLAMGWINEGVVMCAHP